MPTCFSLVHRFASVVGTAIVSESPLVTAATRLPPTGQAGSLPHLLHPKALLQKHHLHRSQVIQVLLLPKAVPFVGGVDGPDRLSFFADFGGDLLSFGERDAGVVFAVDDEEVGFD